MQTNWDTCEKLVLYHCTKLGMDDLVRPDHKPKHTFGVLLKSWWSDKTKDPNWAPYDWFKLKVVFTLTKAKVIWARKPRKGHKINIFITTFTIAPIQLKLIELYKKQNRRPAWLSLFKLCLAAWPMYHLMLKQNRRKVSGKHKQAEVTQVAKAVPPAQADNQGSAQTASKSRVKVKHW